MTGDDSNREREIFGQAMDVASPQERAEFLAGACRGEARLRQRVEALLRVNDEAEAFLPTQPGVANDPAGAGSVAIVTEQPGDNVDRYKLLQIIGEGGCGVVYLAEQEEPFRRRVALKVIKLGLDTKAVIARFEAERQALALMDHPNIAKVLDAGATERGRPYFVMELVRGVKITEYCDQNHLSTRERLELFVKVCQAIQHAHQKGIIHRDIKPSNILVTLHDGVPVPKVIDFGIAKATDQRLTDKTLFTALEQFIGTPAYMSPEQAELSGLDIDTRSDVYSLGVLLYELLTGHTPFDPELLQRSALDEMRRIIREDDPVRPSTRLSTLSLTDSAELAKHRKEKIPALISLIRGDLDWIVMKALEKDRTRRYETANGLAMDIIRHLNTEPVRARPPSRLYQLQKLARRNKATFTALGAVTGSLVLGVVLTTWQAVQSTRARREADVARWRASQNAVRAERSELAARQKAYASDMGLAQQALAVHNLGRAQELLDRNRPGPGEADQRGWEWRYLWQQTRSDAQYKLAQITNPIGALAVSFDQKWVAFGGEQHGSIHIWDLPARQEILRLPAGDTDVRAAFSPREPLLAFSLASDSDAAKRQFKVVLWNASSQRSVAELPLSGLCLGLQFSADGQTLITATTQTIPSRGPGDYITLWRIRDREKLAEFMAPQEWSDGTPFAVAPDFGVAAYGTSKGRIRVIDLANGQERWSAQGAGELITALAISPDGKTLASGEGFIESDIRFWDLASGIEAKRLQGHRGWITQLIYWPDGRTLASASSDQTIRLWDLNLFQPMRILRGHRLEVSRLALLGDHKTLLSGCKDGSIYAWDTHASRSESIRLDFPGAFKAWRFAPDGQSILTCDAFGQVASWQGPGFVSPEPLLDLKTNLLRANLSPDCRFLAAGLGIGFVQVWDLKQKRLLHQIRGLVNEEPLCLMFLPDGQHLLTLSPNGRSVQYSSVSPEGEVRSLAALEDPVTGAGSIDGQWCLLLDWHGNSLLKQMTTGQEFHLHLDLGQPWGAAFSPDAKLFAIASPSGLAGLFETATLREIGTIRGFLQGVHAVAFSPDGRRLATGSDGREAVKLWDSQSLQEVLTLEGRSSIFSSVSFSPDGDSLGAMSLRGTLHVWRAPSWGEFAAAEKLNAPSR